MKWKWNEMEMKWNEMNELKCQSRTNADVAWVNADQVQLATCVRLVLHEVRLIPRPIADLVRAMSWAHNNASAAWAQIGSLSWAPSTYTGRKPYATVCSSGTGSVPASSAFILQRRLSEWSHSALCNQGAGVGRPWLGGWSCARLKAGAMGWQH